MMAWRPKFSRRLWLGVAICLLISAVSAGGAYWAAYQLLIQEAQLHIEDILLTHRGLHNYIQRVMHPMYYLAMDQGEVDKTFYSPQVLSSSYMVRVTHGFINEERKAAGLSEIYYKMAATNPRNPVNKADEHEEALIRMFNHDRTQKDHREVLSMNGKQYLCYTVPFLETTDRCLKCHGKREDAPLGLQALYPGEGGFNEKSGTIRAVESIRVPMSGERRLAGAASIAATTGLFSFIMLLGFNRTLQSRVRVRTVQLESEVSERRQIEKSLRNSEGRLLQIAENAKEWIWEIDTQGRYTFASPGVQAILGYSDKEIFGKKAFSAFAHPDSQAETELAFAALFAAQKTFRGFISRHITKEGKPIWLSSSGIAIFDGEGRFSGYRGVDADITDQKEAEEALRQNEEHLRQMQKMESVGRLAGGIAHDLNNMLAVILGYGEILEEDLPAGDPDHENVREILAAGQRARDLTRQLLAFSRKQLLEMHPVDVAEMVNGLKNMLGRLLGEDITFKVIAAPGTARVNADRSQLEQVLMNLCVNARDAMPGGGTLTIETSQILLDEYYVSSHPGIKPGRYVQLTVSDSGCGMDAETKRHIFEPFYTTKDTGKGTGLGLATAYGIVKQHGGDIWVYSEPGKGTAFKVYLPRIEADSVVDEKPADAMIRGNGETILLIEDETAVRRLVAQMLERLGYHVLEAATPEECEAFAAGPEPIGLLLADVIMPGMNGRQLYERLLEKRPGLNVLFMSGYTENAIAHHGILDAEVNFIPKPFTELALSQKIHEALKQRKVFLTPV